MNIKGYKGYAARVFWLLYFFFIIFLSFYRIFEAGSFDEWLDFFISFPSVVGLYLYISRKNFLIMHLWRAYFFVLLTWDIYRSIFLKNIVLLKLMGAEAELNWFLIIIIILLPLYFALFRMAFPGAGPVQNK